MIRLETVTQNNYRCSLELKVTEEQKYFVSLAKTYVLYYSATPYIIYNDDVSETL